MAAYVWDCGIPLIMVLNSITIIYLKYFLIQWIECSLLQIKHNPIVNRLQEDTINVLLLSDLFFVMC